jgi:hypothetical protein
MTGGADVSSKAQLVRVPEEVEKEHTLLFKSLRGNAAEISTFNITYYILQCTKDQVAVV